MSKGMRRFWKQATAINNGENWQILLDGRQVRTPAGAELNLPTAALAEAVSDEWQAQQDEIDATTMPCFGFAVTAIDRVMPQRDMVIDELSRYGAFDLLCQREGDDLQLAAEQHRLWQPWLDWADQDLQARLETTEGIMPLKQADNAVNRLRGVIAGHDDFRLAGLHQLVTVSGSLVLGLAIGQNRLSAGEGFDLAFLDETWQAGKWGMDDEAEARRHRLRTAMSHASKYLHLLG